MLQTNFLLLIIFIIAMMLAVAFGFLNYKIKRKTFDFYMMFLMGIAWVVLGFLFKIWFLLAIGLLFFIIGFVKRGEWDDDISNLNRGHQAEIFSVREQTDITERTFIGIIILGVLILGVVIFYIFF